MLLFLSYLSQEVFRTCIPTSHPSPPPHLLLHPHPCVLLIYMLHFSQSEYTLVPSTSLTCKPYTCYLLHQHPTPHPLPPVFTWILFIFRSQLCPHVSGESSPDPSAWAGCSSPYRFLQATLLSPHRPTLSHHVVTVCLMACLLTVASTWSWLNTGHLAHVWHTVDTW